MPAMSDCKQEIVPVKGIKDVLDAANSSSNWTLVRQKSYDQIYKIISDYNGINFTGDQRTYGLSTRGSYAVFLVPTAHTKSLIKFRGRLVLIICTNRSEMWPGYSGRRFAAIPISPSGQLENVEIEGSDP